MMPPNATVRSTGTPKIFASFGYLSRHPLQRRTPKASEHPEREIRWLTKTQRERERERRRERRGTTRTKAAPTTEPRGCRPRTADPPCPSLHQRSRRTGRRGASPGALGGHKFEAVVVFRFGANFGCGRLSQERTQSGDLGVLRSTHVVFRQSKAVWLLVRGAVKEAKGKFGWTESVAH
eukprot:scaffold225_cov235-Pinguiococcus_pyrenoidosus.AAC.9